MEVQTVADETIFLVTLENLTVEGEESSPTEIWLDNPTIDIIEVLERGEDGQNGDDGNGSDLSYTHIQTSPSTIWVVNHNLGKYPTPIAVDSAGGNIMDAPVMNSINQLTYNFSVPLSGKVHCN